jgi:hypothetical protein
VQTNIDAARHDPEIDVGSHMISKSPAHGPRFDGIEGIDTCLGIETGPYSAARERGNEYPSCLRATTTSGEIPSPEVRDSPLLQLRCPSDQHLSPKRCL